MLQSKQRLLELNAKLAEILTSKDVTATADETTTALINKVDWITTTICDNTPKFLKKITLTDDVNAITVDLSDYIDKYYMFLIYPDLQFSTSEWLYIYPNGSSMSGYYKEATSISVNDDIKNTAVLINFNQGSYIFALTSYRTFLGLSSNLSNGFTCRLYIPTNSILTGSSLKIYGIKGDILNVDL